MIAIQSEWGYFDERNWVTATGTHKKKITRNPKWKTKLRWRLVRTTHLPRFSFWNAFTIIYNAGDLSSLNARFKSSSVFFLLSSSFYSNRRAHLTVHEPYWHLHRTTSHSLRNSIIYNLWANFTSVWRQRSTPVNEQTKKKFKKKNVKKNNDFK